MQINSPLSNSLPQAGERTNEKIISISDLITARYKEGGRGPDAYDCFGLFAELCRRRGLDIPQHPSPSALCEREALIESVAAAEWDRLDEAETGCAVVLRIGPWMSHIGMVLEEGRFIHASSKFGIAIARLDDVRWEKRIAGFYRYAGAQLLPQSGLSANVSEA